MDSVDSTIVDRALAAIRVQSGDPNISIKRALPPFLFSARSMYGVAPIQWASTLWNVREISIPTDSSVRTSIVLPKGSGRITFTLDFVRPFAFYVEVTAQLGHPAMGVRWDALMSDEGPVNNVATRDPHTGRYFFATPRAERDQVHITVDAMVPGAPDDATMVVHQIDLICFE